MLESINQHVTLYLDSLNSPDFYWQISLVASACLVSWVLSLLLKPRLNRHHLESGKARLAFAWFNPESLRPLCLPLLLVMSLGGIDFVSPEFSGKSWVLRAAQSVALIWLLFVIISRFIQSPSIVFVIKWIGIPIGLLHIADLLVPLTLWLDTYSLKVGNINLTLYSVLRTLLFGFLLFWLGRWSNKTGQKMIRSRPNFDSATREIMSKLFEIAVFVLVFLLLLNIIGIDLTALAVFGGALGVGLGFGLQQIASNFISGIIILLDRSISIGDYIQLEDGRSGRLRELSMRSATLETFDGKDIMVPNEKFITTSFTNWTHNNQQQRYQLKFQVAYETDLDLLFEVIRDVVSSHPQVISGDHLPIELKPDAEIEKFGENGINILVEFWMDDIDDGKNRVGADLNYMIWGALRQHNIKIPFPRRDVKVLKDAAGTLDSTDNRQ